MYDFKSNNVSTAQLSGTTAIFWNTNGFDKNSHYSPFLMTKSEFSIAFNVSHLWQQIVIFDKM